MLSAEGFNSFPLFLSLLPRKHCTQTLIAFTLHITSLITIQEIAYMRYSGTEHVTNQLYFVVLEGVYLETEFQVSQAGLLAYYVPEDDPELLIFLPLPDKCF